MDFAPRVGVPVGLDAQQLLLVVPLVERFALVETLVALQADQAGAGHLGDRLGELRLAGAGRPFDEHRLAEPVGEEGDAGDAVVGEVVRRRAGRREPAGRSRTGSPPLLPCSARYRPVLTARSIGYRRRAAATRLRSAAMAGTARRVRDCVRRRRRRRAVGAVGRRSPARVRGRGRPTRRRRSSTATGGSPAAELEAWLDDIGTAARTAGADHVRAAPRVRPDHAASGNGSTRRARCSTCCSGPTPATASRRANAYYELALKLAHASAAIDLVPSPDEIAAIDQLPHDDARGDGRRRRAAARASPATRGGRQRGAAADARAAARAPSCRPNDRSRICSPSSTR